MTYWVDPHMADPGFTYFIRAVHPIARIKIGTARNPARRLSELQTSSPTPLELLKVIPGGRAMEAAWHRRFDDLRRHLEWFDQTDELLDAITTMPSADEFTAWRDPTSPWRELPVTDGDRTVIAVEHPCRSCQHPRDCAGCSLEISFNGHSTERRFCSPPKPVAAPSRECPQCGLTFEGNTKYCGPGCVSRASSIRMRQRMRAKDTGIPAEAPMTAPPILRQKEDKCSSP
jgi:hypothetical protein